MNLAQSTKGEKNTRSRAEQFLHLLCLLHLHILEKEKFLLHLYWLHIGQQVYEGIAVQNNISNMAHIVGGIVGAIIAYGLNVKSKFGFNK